MKKLPTPYAKARTEAHSWAYRFDEDETAPFVCPSLDDESDIIPGMVCRNTGCCDDNGAPIYEHDYVAVWHTIGRTLFRDTAELLYADGILVKHIDGIPDVPVAYSYLHDIRRPLRLDGTKVVGNSYTQPRNTCRLSDVEYDRLIRAKKQKTKKKDKEYQ